MTLGNFEKKKKYYSQVLKIKHPQSRARRVRRFWF